MAACRGEIWGGDERRHFSDSGTAEGAARFYRQHRRNAHPHAGRALPLHESDGADQAEHNLPADVERERSQIARLRRLADTHPDLDFAEKFLNPSSARLSAQEAIVAQNGSGALQGKARRHDPKA